MKELIEKRIKQLEGFKACPAIAVKHRTQQENLKSLDFKCGFVYAIKEEINFLEILLSEIE
jgi:hypothetical protein